jgi:hypothetical protein
MQFECWNDQDNKAAVLNAHPARHPFLLNQLFRVSTTFKSWVIDSANSNLMYEKAQNCLSALSVRLGTQNYFFGDIPCTIDATVFGHLVLQLKAPLPNPVLSKIIMQHPNLVSYVDRILALYFNPSVPLPPAAGGPPKTTNISYPIRLPTTQSPHLRAAAHLQQATSSLKETTLMENSAHFLALSAVSAFIFSLPLIRDIYDNIRKDDN